MNVVAVISHLFIGFICAVVMHWWYNGKSPLSTKIPFDHMDGFVLICFWPVAVPLIILIQLMICGMTVTPIAFFSNLLSKLEKRGKK